MAQAGKNRSRLTGSFVHALCEDFEAEGRAAIEKCRENNPAKYLAIIASVIPKELEIIRPLDDLTDDQLAAAVAAARALATAGALSQPVAPDSGSGAGPAPGPEPAGELPAVSETI